MPRTILIGIGLYVIALLIGYSGGGVFGALLGTPMLIYQGFLLYRLVRRDNWARIALLLIASFLAFRKLFENGSLFRLASTVNSSLVFSTDWQSLRIASLRLLGTLCLFSKSSSTWFFSGEHKASEFADSGERANDRMSLLLRKFRFGSPQSIGKGVLAAAIPILFVQWTVQGVKSAYRDTQQTTIVSPGDADYPVEVTAPGKIVALSAIHNELSNYQFFAEYSTDEKLCRRQIGLGGEFAENLRKPVDMKRDSTGIYRGTVAIDKYQAGRCGWHFDGIEYEDTDGVSNALAIILGGSPANGSVTRHVDIWCYRVAEGRFASPSPRCEVLAELAKPNVIRRVSPAFLSTLTRSRSADMGRAEITPETREVTVEFHDLNAIPGALLPVGDAAQQREAADEYRLTRERSPEGQAAKCFDSANRDYARKRPPPDTDTATNHTQWETVLSLKNACRAQFGLPPVTSPGG